MLWSSLSASRLYLPAYPSYLPTLPYPTSPHTYVSTSPTYTHLEQDALVVLVRQQAQLLDLPVLLRAEGPCVDMF